MAAFPIHPLDRFTRGGQTTIRRPREFAYFSFDDQHRLHSFSTESLRYYYPPTFGAPSKTDSEVDLSAGFQSFIQRDDTVDEHLDALLDTLQVGEERLLERAKSSEGSVQDARTRADVVTWRGMMTKILTAPFDDFSDFEMNATCYQGTIFIEEHHAHKEAQSRSQNSQPPRQGQLSQELMQYCGYKFETLSVLPKPWAECTRQDIEGREIAVVNNNAQYCSIVRTGIGQCSLIIGGEVDAVLGEKPVDTDHGIPWVELKTTQELHGSHPREIMKYERKVLKYWAQSFLLGVPKIVVGFRTSDGKLARIKDLETQKIPQQVRNGSGTWDGNVCINFTGAFLDFLKRTVTSEGVWRIRRRRNAREIEVFKIEETGYGRVLKPSFVVHRDKLRAMEIAAALGREAAG